MKTKQQKLIEVKKEDVEAKVYKGFQMRTVSNFPLDEVISAIQKSIRRGEEKEAIYWTYEVVDSGMWRYLFRRLSIIACEDVGLADSWAIVVVDAISSRLENQ